MKKILILALLSVFAVGMAKAGEIVSIEDTSRSDDTVVSYPVRNDALIVVLQHVPDGSNEYIMNICSKKGYCRQTSMLPTEVRYIGPFLEDVGPALVKDLSQKIPAKQYVEKQMNFREMYADYMNLYDQNRGDLHSLKR